MSLRALFIGLLLTVLVAPVTALAGGWMIYHDGPYTGVVLDDETGEPIVGAAVVAEWDLNLYGGVGGVLNVFFDARETITDEQGKFTIDSKIGFYWWPLTSIKPVQLTIYKPGYDSYPPKLPLLSSQATDVEHERARTYRMNFWIDVHKDKFNVIRLARAATRRERIHIVTTQDIYKIHENGINIIPHFTKFIDSEREYLGFVDK